MSLEIFTARIHYTGADRLDVTRQTDTEHRKANGGARGPGDPFAPSWVILKKAKAELAARTPGAWERYVEAYTAEMRRSYKLRKDAWRQLLERQGQIALLCFCADAARCHRTLLARCLVKAAERFGIPGVAYFGERGYSRHAREMQQARRSA